MKQYFIAITLVLSSVVTSASTTASVDGLKLITDGYKILEAMPNNQSMLNSQVCMNQSGRIVLIYSYDFRYNLAYVYDENIQEFNAPIHVDQLNLQYLGAIEEQNGIEIFNAKLGSIDLICAKSLMVLE
jgi:hypothetical protein